jgi:hypothetical protein
MGRSSLTYIPGFSVKFFFQPIYTEIEQFWPFEEISIFSNSSHLEWRAGLSDTAKNRKRGDEILIVHCCFSVSQNECKF